MKPMMPSLRTISTGIMEKANIAIMAIIPKKACRVT